jgi:Alpha/beta hydrolase domain
MRRPILVLLTLLALASLLGAARAGASPNSTAGDITPPTATPVGTFGGIEYTQYDGIFIGRTSTGAYRVPYRITAPAHPRKGNGTVVVEPPHFAMGLGALNLVLGREMLLTRGFAHAGVGYSTSDFTQPGGPPGNLRILDPTVPDVFIDGGFVDPDFGGNTDDEIIVDFARALVDDPDAQSMLGAVKRQYLTGFSDSSQPVLRIVNSGQARGVVDLVFPFTAFGADPQTALVADRYTGKVVIVNSEWQVEPSPNLIDRGVAGGHYRFYAVAGSPHVPDLLVPGFFSNMTTPASYQPELRAHFMQAHRWVTEDESPPSSTHLLTVNGILVRDANGNAITVDARGRRVPRLPYIELGEARYNGNAFIGTYDQVKTLADLGFASTSDYLKAFRKALNAYVNAQGILSADEEAMQRRAALCPGLTFTQTYRDHYDNFAQIQPCG